MPIRIAYEFKLIDSVFGANNEKPEEKKKRKSWRTAFYQSAPLIRMMRGCIKGKKEGGGKGC